METMDERGHLLEKKRNLLIHGYLNRLKKKALSIPKPIYAIIEKYYQIGVWGVIDDGLFIHNYYRIKQLQDNRWKNVFSAESFSEGVVPFKLKMHGYQFFVGVIPTKSIKLNAGLALGHPGLKDSIGYWNDEGQIENDSNRTSAKGEPYKNGDIITVTLDFEQNSVFFQKNGQSRTALAIKPNTCYSFGASVIYSYGVEFIPCE